MASITPTFFVIFYPLCVDTTLVMVDNTLEMMGYDLGGERGSDVDRGGRDPGELNSQSSMYNLPIRKELTRINTLPPNGDEPVNISIHLALESIRSISADASFDFYLGLQWFDIREINLDIFLSGPRTSYFSWIPDLYFILARKVSKTEDTQYLSISNGTMLFDRRISVTTPCETTPFAYPFDSVQCKIFLSSYGYDDSKVHLFWSDDGISMPKSYQGLDYVGFKWAKHEPIKVLQTEVSQYAGLEYSILSCSLSFQRLYHPYVFQLFIPAAFLVVISWTTFWINMTATPGRAGVGITTILSLLTLTTNRRQDSDNLYLALHSTMLDIYLWVSFIYVNAAFLQFALTDYLNTSGRKEWKTAAQTINKTCRLLFPSSFVIFNLVFWVSVARYML